SNNLLASVGVLVWRMTVNLSAKKSEFNHVVAGFVKIPFLCLKLDQSRHRIIFPDPLVVNTM
ncbi:MAG: hypothetical protein VX264_10480, partial [Chloroflexota bacterium]|nr:hypothetical protein [Chloroflexota bacterium]